MLLLIVFVVFEILCSQRVDCNADLSDFEVCNRYNIDNTGLVCKPFPCSFHYFWVYSTHSLSFVVWNSNIIPLPLAVKVHLYWVRFVSCSLQGGLIVLTYWKHEIFWSADAVMMLSHILVPHPTEGGKIVLRNQILINFSICLSLLP